MVGVTSSETESKLQRHHLWHGKKYDTWIKLVYEVDQPVLSKHTTFQANCVVAHDVHSIFPNYAEMLYFRLIPETNYE